MKIIETKGDWLAVTLEENTKEEAVDTNALQVTTPNKDEHVFKKATILEANDSGYPKGSQWIVGNIDGMKIDFFGDKITFITKRDLYARLK